jgi:hypothetical protein
MLFAFVFVSPNVSAQKNNSPEQEHTITPQDGRNKEKENRRKKEEEYQLKKQHHEQIQDKATLKRMKESRKKAEKNASPGRKPWYKKIFRF